MLNAFFKCIKINLSYFSLLFLSHIMDDNKLEVKSEIKLGEKDVDEKQVSYTHQKFL